MGAGCGQALLWIYLHWVRIGGRVPAKVFAVELDPARYGVLCNAIAEFREFLQAGGYPVVGEETHLVTKLANLLDVDAAPFVPHGTVAFCFDKVVPLVVVVVEVRSAKHMV